MRTVRSIAFLVVVGSVLVGCAATRSELDVSVPKPAVTPTKAAVKITNVTDSRRFEINPRSPSTPSVRDNEIDNKQLIARAVGRKRGGFGNAWGDVVLPEGQTVSGLVEEALVAALAEKGYAVLARDAPGYDGAIPLSADVLKFWSWVTPGWAISITHESQIRLTGPWPLRLDNREISGYAYYKSYVAIVESDWGDLLNNGLADLQQNLAKELK